MPLRTVLSRLLPREAMRVRFRWLRALTPGRHSETVPVRSKRSIYWSTVFCWSKYCWTHSSHSSNHIHTQMWVLIEVMLIRKPENRCEDQLYFECWLECWNWRDNKKYMNSWKCIYWLTVFCWIKQCWTCSSHSSNQIYIRVWVLIEPVLGRNQETQHVNATIFKFLFYTPAKATTVPHVTGKGSEEEWSQKSSVDIYTSVYFAFKFRFSQETIFRRIPGDVFCFCPCLFLQLITNYC